jgi:hypothetical protein
MTVPIPSRNLGSRRLKVSALGLGCMTMTDVYGPGAEASAVATIDRALELGVFFLDTADTCADGANERLVGHALTGRRDRVFLARKFGFVFPDGGGHLNGRPEYVKVACEASLRRLGTDHIDLYYLHRVDPEVPVEETVGAMARLVAEGKVLHLGLSGPMPAPCAGPTPSIRSRRWRPSGRYGPGTSRRRSCRPHGNSASASSRTAHWEGASSPGRSPASPTWRPTTGGAPTPVFPARTSTATCVWSRPSRRSRPRRA